MTAIPEDLDFLVARVHGRRGRVAEAERLEALCRLRSQAELARAVFPEAEFLGVSGFQRRLVQDWLKEMETWALGLNPPRSRMIQALADRLRVEDLKLRIRGKAAGLGPDALREHLLSPRANPAPSLDTPSARILGAEDAVKGAEGAWPRAFLRETTLDRDHFRELLVALRGLDLQDRARIRALVLQEVDHFQLMLVVRGRFLHGLEAEHLRSWHIEGAGITSERFAHMLAAPELSQVVKLAVGFALDALPERCEPSLLEALAWGRFLRLARRAYRQGPMDFGTLVGYAALRRMEVANLITLSEGIRLGIPGEILSARLIPRRGGEAACA
ncbi:MAG TPA: V-type ATPase subunit [Holophaga sp.]|nr:V-type ATPase subunit [Holophaga sp.]